MVYWAVQQHQPINGIDSGCGGVHPLQNDLHFRFLCVPA
jgi:hypothetical protein